MRRYVVGEEVHPTLVQLLDQRGWCSYNGDLFSTTSAKSVASSRGKELPDKLDARLKASTSWDLMWKHTRFDASVYSNCMAHQRVNHFARTSGLTNKAWLGRNIRRMNNVHGAVYGFLPRTYILPRERPQLLLEHRAADGDRKIWICKPSASSKGQDIYIVDDVSSIVNRSSNNVMVVQRYIDQPYLIKGYKFDLRLYVLVLSFQPLVSYLHQDGLARFTTEPYTARRSAFSNLYSHLTNYSVNKGNSISMAEDKPTIGKGNKWTLSKLLTYLQREDGVNVRLILRRIKRLVALTLLSIVHEVSANINSFELFGFDVILDSNLKPWLLEVNSSPAVGVHCAIDAQVKPRMIQDLLDIIWPEGPSIDLRKQQGGFELIFPFDEVTCEATRRFEKAAAMGERHLPNAVRILIQSGVDSIKASVKRTVEKSNVDTTKL